MHLVLNFYLIFQKKSLLEQISAHMNCINCKHFFITWETKFPYGCNAYEIKSKSAPNLQVLENTGLACLLFDLKKQEALDQTINFQKKF